MSNITLLHYNNYFNRIVKKEEFYTSYLTSDPHYNKIENVNFVPGDGITTSLILGTYSLSMGFDYVVVTEIINGAETIVSRWFLMEENRTRGGQYELTLRRDLIVDNYNSIINSPIYLEKATIKDINNPLLYNSENFNVNQIKTSETLIKDRSNIAWLVGYCSSKLAKEVKTIETATVTLSSSGAASGSFIYTASVSYISIFIQLGNDKYYNGQGGFTATFNPSSSVVTYSINNSSWSGRTVSIKVNYTSVDRVSSLNCYVNIPGDESRSHLKDAPYDMFAIPFGTIKLHTANIETTKEDALELAFEFVKDLGSDAIYDVQLLPYCPRQDIFLKGELYETLVGKVGYDYTYIYETARPQIIKSIMIWCKKSTDGFSATSQEVIGVPRDVESTAVSKTVSNSTARISRTLSSTNATVTIYSDEFKKGVITAVASLSASKGAYSDSVTTFTSFSQSIDAGSLQVTYSGTSFPLGSQSNVNVSVVFSIKPYKYPDYIDYKVSNECDLFRLTSPNYSGQFEWSIAKCSGRVSLFSVDFTYKPYQPYIHIAPAFAFLYGSDFDDARGLTCAGDFSMPTITDAWTEYEVHNKTYQDVFDRQIQSMDTEHVLASGESAVGMVTGTMMGGIAGGVAGGKLGGGAGAAAGAIVGTGASLAGGIVDFANQQARYAEGKSYATDMFNYSLQNVKALPYGLTKISAYNANNKIFPMVEYYTCKEVEKEALRNKLKYNGMTVMIISTLNDFIDQNDTERRFFKGEFIRFDSLNQDSHMAYEINNELKKGVYI